jgi:hypothetical protein
MGKRKSKQVKLNDVYQAEESDAEEDKQAGQRYDVSASAPCILTDLVPAFLCSSVKQLL